MAIGDGICLPVANHDSVSHTQKSVSICDAIACFSVTIMSSIISNFCPFAFKCSMIGFSGAVLLVVVSLNVMSENVGADICVKSGISNSGSFIGSISKSVGNGIFSKSDSGISGVGLVFSGAL